MKIEFKSVIHRHSYIPGVVPSPSEVMRGELALNLADGKLFTLGLDGLIVDLTAANSKFFFAYSQNGYVLTYDVTKERYTPQLVNPEYSIGGFRTVLTIAQRDDIPNEMRREGMLVYVTADQKIYLLMAGNTNSNWVELQNTFMVDGGTY